MLFGSLKIKDINIIIGGNQIAIWKKLKNLGQIVNKNLNFTNHVSHILQIAYAKMRIHCANREILSMYLKTQLCNSLVLSHANHCDYVCGLYITQRF